MTDKTFIAVSKNKQDLFRDIVEEVQVNRVQPEDMYEIAAYLESVGWNDDRAAEVFGAEDIFELASNIWDSIQSKILAKPYIPPERHALLYYAVEGIKSFLRGMIFALPMAISVFAMLNLKFSLWSYQYLSVETATSIAIGTILSFMTIGGFTQSIARRGFFYITQGYYNMARRMTFYFVRFGFVVCSLLAVASLAFNFFFEVFPMRMVMTIVLFYFFLSAIWLSVTIMYILKKELAFTGLLIVGIVIVFVLKEIFGLYIITSQIIALSIITISGILLVIYYFKTAELKSEKGISPPLPRKSITLYSVMPYFLYGFLYFTFLYIDRIMAWSANDRNYMPFLIWFRGGYELGMDFGLLVIIIPMGLIEVVVTKIMTEAEIVQKNYMGYEAQSMNNKFVRMYIYRLVFVSILSSILGLISYLIIRFIDLNYGDYFDMKIIESPTTHFVLVWSILGYVVLVVALMNAIILFSLSQPEVVNKALIKSLLANAAVGFLMSRWMSWILSEYPGLFLGVSGYAFAVIGLFVGSVIFMILTSIQVIKTLRSLDYYLYAIS